VICDREDSLGGGNQRSAAIGSISQPGQTETDKFPSEPGMSPIGAEHNAYSPDPTIQISLLHPLDRPVNVQNSQNLSEENDQNL
jgi:hypothetical protein